MSINSEIKSSASTAIVVPCYNEAMRLRSDLFHDAVLNSKLFDFIFVDDGSSDDTYTVLSGLCAKAPDRMRCIRLERNRGKAEAVRQGFLEAIREGYGIVGYWDADLATPLDTIPRLIPLFDDPFVLLVMCSRVKLLGRRIERQPKRHYSGRVFATCASLVLGLGVYDTQCGAKLFRTTDALRRVFDLPFTVTWIFDVEILARFLVLEHMGVLPSGALEKGVIEYPVEEWRDVPGSKIRMGDFFRAPMQLFRIYRYLRSNTRARGTFAGRR